MTGLTRDGLHRYQWDGGPKVPGVTTIAGFAENLGFLRDWATGITSRAALRELKELTERAAKDPFDAAKWLAKVADDEMDEGRNTGSAVHQLLEAEALGNEIHPTPKEAPYIEAFHRDILEVYRPEVLHVEYLVFSEKHRYGGTADAAWRIDGDTCLVDFKSGKKVTGLMKLQLAGLHWADFFGRPGDPQKYRIPQATKFAIVHIRPDGARLVWMDVTEADFEVFLLCRRLYDYASVNKEAA